MTYLPPSRLDSLFRPRGVALVGASDKSLFSRTAFANLVAMGFGDHTHLVNRRVDVVHGRSAVASLTDLDGDVDVALMMVPQPVMLDSLAEAAEAGVRNAVILSAGYGEAGEAGREAERELVAHAQALDMVVLGPNHLGFINFVDRVPVMALPELPVRQGPVALLSQSGGSISAMSQFAAMVGVDFSFLVSLGNEAMVTAGNALEFVVEDPSTKAVALFVETIRDAEAFARGARRAAELGKAVVAFKAGTSQLAAKSAAAHTGAFVGDDAVIDAVFAELGVIRVNSIEQMVTTAGAAAYLGHVEPGGLGIVTHSGGACDIVADIAERVGVDLTPLSPATVARLEEILPSYATAQNPLDVTGAGVNDASILRGSIEAVGADPGVSVVAVVNSLPWEADDPWARQAMTEAIGAGLVGATRPGVFVNQVMQPVSPRTREIMGKTQIEWFLPGMEYGITALADVLRWSQWWRARQAQYNVEETAVDLLGLEPGEHWSEWQVRGVLERAGVSFVPTTVVTSEAEARALAGDVPMAVKVICPQIAHKSDIGGVVLGARGPAEVVAAFRSVTDAGRAVPGAQVDGALLSPMRTGGVELLLGVSRDRQWGLVLAIAFGGIYTELLADSVLIPLPASVSTISSAMTRLRGIGILQGARGLPPADLEAIAAVAARLGAVAHALGDQLDAIEINPLRVDGSLVEALDAAVSWQSNGQ